MSVAGLSGYELKSASDFQQLVDDIETLLASPTGVAPEAVTRLQEFYDQATKLVNARLRQCDDLLKKGLRNEALELCDFEPKLLDLFLILDFPERETWMETVKQCGSVSTELLIGVAMELTDAAAAVKPLAELMYQVRLHALARSPLPTRIQVMRQLSKLDTDNPVWEEDLRVFEKARHNQLASEVQLAIKAASFEKLSGLDEELRNPDWLTPPAKGIVKQVNDMLAALRRQQARQELQRLEPSLVAAFAAFDVVQGRQIREEWQRCAKIALLPPDDPLLASVQPALNWLQEQDQQERDQAAYEEALAGLSRALDKGANRLVLEQKYHALMSLGQGIPDELRLRLEERLAWQAQVTARRQKLKLSAIAIILLMVIGIGVFAYRSAAYRSQVDAHVATLRGMIDNKELVEAERHLTKLEAESPSIAAEPPIRKLAVELKTAQQADEKRVAEFRQLLDSARREGVEKATLKTIPGALKTLTVAWEMRAYDSETAEIKGLIQEVNATRDRLQKDIDEKFLAEVKEFEQKFAGWEPQPLDHLKLLQQLKVSLKDIHDREFVTDRSAAQRLLTRTDQAIKLGERLQTEARILQDLTVNLGDRVKYLAELERYAAASEFAGTSRQQDFQRVLKEDASNLLGYQNWSTYLDALEAYDLTKVDLARAVKLRTDAEKLLKDHPGFWFTPLIQDAMGYLGKSAARERGSPAMEQLLAQPFFKAKVIRFKDKSGETQLYYFSGKDPEPDKTSVISVPAFIDIEFKTMKPTPRLDAASVQNRNDWQSPQSQFALEATDLLSKLREQKGANWDATFIELLGNLYRNPHLDKFLKVQLIGFVIRVSGDGSDFLPRRLEKIRKDIELENLNPKVNWVSADDAEAVQARTVAKTLLDRMKSDLADTKTLLKDAELSLGFVKKPRLDDRHVWSGWLQKNSNKSWTCNLRTNGTMNAKDGDLFLLTTSPEGEIRFQRIGRVQQGRVTLESESPEFFEGRPVFSKKS